MPRLSEIANRDEKLTRTMLIETPRGDRIPVEVTFYPNRVTFESEDASLNGHEAMIAQETDAEGRTGARAAARFCHLVAAWDIVDDEERMVPLTVERIRPVAGWLTTGIMNAIMETVFPNLRESRRLLARS